MNPIELYNQFFKFIEQGDEKGARAFLVDHLNDFPEDIREKIAFAFFEEALHSEAEGIEANAQVQKEGEKLLGDLAEVEKILEDAKKAAEIKESL